MEMLAFYTAKERNTHTHTPYTIAANEPLPASHTFIQQQQTRWHQTASTESKSVNIYKDKNGKASCFSFLLSTNSGRGRSLSTAVRARNQHSPCLEGLRVSMRGGQDDTGNCPVCLMQEDTKYCENARDDSAHPNHRAEVKAYERCFPALLTDVWEGKA
jgi:hypothetical protein